MGGPRALSHVVGKGCWSARPRCGVLSPNEALQVFQPRSVPPAFQPVFPIAEAAAIAPEGVPGQWMRPNAIQRLIHIICQSVTQARLLLLKITEGFLQFGLGGLGKRPRSPAVLGHHRIGSDQWHLTPVNGGSTILALHDPAGLQITLRGAYQAEQGIQQLGLFLWRPSSGLVDQRLHPCIHGYFSWPDRGIQIPVGYCRLILAAKGVLVNAGLPAHPVRYSNRIAPIRAKASSVMCWGTVSFRRTFRTRQSSVFNWWQWMAPWVSVPAPIKVTTVP